ncbi:MAG: type II toxin-antitoxin system death-on-curing family toxin [Kineosporiaceae bacterium]|nr:type II toxin-antitoxin system death-on-curing family toxin [Kineosporiaceae bacterium]MBK7623840.1 type II toxin-antitoxin system death-on-curing family toxin [Kineosporiaceae bacterium]MBK8075597.1 type II toxin-antitoxin system death-on-curing family toxin [Kineosporiaceae bacterium]
MTYLTLDDLLGYIDVAGWGPIRDIGLLDSACQRPRSSAFGVDAYPDLHSKAAALMHSLVKNHALVDGNKRIAWLATLMFLGRNGFTVNAGPDKETAFVLAAAAGEIDTPQIAAQLQEWIVPLER